MDRKDDYLADDNVEPRTTSFGLPVADSSTQDCWFYDDEPPEFVESTTRYDIIGELGRGGMGIVYRARDTGLNRDVALKVLLPELLGRPKILHQFMTEARIMGALQHPGIAHVYECGRTADGRPFHSMKLVQGKTMHAILKDQPQDQPGKARLLNIFSQVCQAMAYSHSQHVIHLDLKPGNVMVGAFGEVRVMDWGLARKLDPFSSSAMDDSGRFTLSDLVSPELSDRVNGTPVYMSPEQACAESVDTRTDVFVLGGMLTEILTGKPTYEGSDREDILRRARTAQLDPAFSRLNECKHEIALARLAKNCLEPNPDNRPQDAAEVAAEMATYSESALEQVETDMIRFFELSLDLFCIAGLDGFFRRINQNFSRVLGYSETELLSEPFLKFVAEEDRNKTAQVMGQLLDGKPVVRFRNRYRKANGELILFEWTAKSIPTEDLIFAVARSVTD
jgi:PAS domain S-box-containing protein